MKISSLSAILAKVFAFSPNSSRRRNRLNSASTTTEAMEVRTLMSAVPVGTPTVTWPTGSVVSAMPIMTWTSATNATSYDVWVDQIGGTKQIIRQTVAGTTSLTAPKPLPPGQYWIWVQAVDAQGLRSRWSTAVEFQVTADAPSLVPGLTSPTGTISALAPNFTWTSAVNARSYDLWVDQVGGRKQIIRQTVIGTTSFASPNALSVGKYRAWVQSIDATGIRSAWSAPRDFEVTQDTTSPVPTLTGPKGASVNTMPTFTWTAATNAKSYDLWVDQVGGTKQIIRKTVSGTTSFTPSQALPAGQYQAWVQAIDAQGKRSNWSVRADFTIAQLSGTKLILNGTGNADAIAVSEGASLEISVNGINFVFTPAQVTEILIQGQSGDDQILVNSLSAKKKLSVEGGDGNDTITIAASVQADTQISGGAGNDRLTGGSGSDILTGGDENDVLVGGTGNDYYVFGEARSSESDTVVELAGGGTDTLNFLAMTTAITVDLNRDDFVATMLNRRIQTSLAGQAANLENVTGGGGDDRITGNSAANVLAGSRGSDTLEGRSGSDRYYFNMTLNNELDTVIEFANDGSDTLDFSGVPTTVTADLTSDQSIATMLNRTVKTGVIGQSRNFENLTSGSGDDNLKGNAAANRIFGGKGNDTLTGGGGIDELDGGSGENMIDGRVEVPSLIVSSVPPAIVNENVSIAGNVSDAGSGISRLIAFVDGGRPVEVAVANDRFNFVTSFATNGTADGTHRVQFRATDGAGNVTDSSEFTWSMDSVAPAVDFDMPVHFTLMGFAGPVEQSPNGYDPSTNGSIFLRGSVFESGTGIVSAKVILDGQPPIDVSITEPSLPISAGGSAGTMADGQFSFTKPVTVDGIYGGRLLVTDAAGNVAEFRFRQVFEGLQRVDSSLWLPNGILVRDTWDHEGTLNRETFLRGSLVQLDVWGNAGFSTTTWDGLGNQSQKSAKGGNTVTEVWTATGGYQRETLGVSRRLESWVDRKKVTEDYWEDSAHPDASHEHTVWDANGSWVSQVFANGTEVLNVTFNAATRQTVRTSRRTVAEYFGLRIQGIVVTTTVNGQFSHEEFNSTDSHGYAISIQLDPSGNSIVRFTGAGDSLNNHIVFIEAVRKAPSGLYDGNPTDYILRRVYDDGSQSIEVHQDGRTVNTEFRTSTGSHSYSRRVGDTVIEKTEDETGLRALSVMNDSGSGFREAYENNVRISRQDYKNNKLISDDHRLSADRFVNLVMDQSGNSSETIYEPTTHRIYSKMQRTSAGLERTTTYLPDGWDRTTVQNGPSGARLVLFREAVRENGLVYQRTTFKDGWAVTDNYRDGKLDWQKVAGTRDGVQLEIAYWDYRVYERPEPVPGQLSVDTTRTTRMVRVVENSVEKFSGLEKLPADLPTGLPRDFLNGATALSIGPDALEQYAKPILQPFQDIAASASDKLSDAGKRLFDQGKAIAAQAVDILTGPVAAIGNIRWNEIVSSVGQVAKGISDLVTATVGIDPAQLVSSVSFDFDTASFLGGNAVNLPNYRGASDIAGIADARMRAFGGVLGDAVQQAGVVGTEVLRVAGQYVEDRFTKPFACERAIGIGQGINWTDPINWQGPRDFLRQVQGQPAEAEAKEKELKDYIDAHYGPDGAAIIKELMFDGRRLSEQHRLQLEEFTRDYMADMLSRNMNTNPDLAAWAKSASTVWLKKNNISENGSFYHDFAQPEYSDPDVALLGDVNDTITGGGGGAGSHANPLPTSPPSTSGANPGTGKESLDNLLSQGRFARTFSNECLPISTELANAMTEVGIPERDRLNDLAKSIADELAEKALDELVNKALTGVPQADVAYNATKAFYEFGTEYNRLYNADAAQRTLSADSSQLIGYGVRTTEIADALAHGKTIWQDKYGVWYQNDDPNYIPKGEWIRRKTPDGRTREPGPSVRAELPGEGERLKYAAAKALPPFIKDMVIRKMKEQAPKDKNSS